MANIDTTNKYSSGRSSEVLKLQQKVNDLTAQNEDLKDEKKHLNLRIREIEADLEVRIFFKLPCLKLPYNDYIIF